MADAGLPVDERLSRLFRQLGISRAHLAGATDEVSSFAAAYPEMVASATLICPFQPIPADKLLPLADRVCFIHGDAGPSAVRVPAVLSQFPDAAEIVLSDYFDAVWSDPV